jgi:hypothetical protein
MTNILQLQGWIVTSTHEHGQDRIIEAEYISPAKEVTVGITYLRCECCTGLFEIKYFLANHIRPNGTNETIQSITICSSCNKRFNTDDVNHNNDVST